MSARRLFAATALATAALTLTLTACDPSPSSSSPATTAAAAPAVSASPVASAPTTASPAPSKTSTKPTSKPSSSSSPAPDCTANAKNPGHKVINATVAWGNPDRIGANATKFICGPDVPNDGYYEATTPNTEYRFAPGAKATLLTGIQEKPVSLATFLQHVNTCTQNATDAYGCYRNMYDVTLDGTGKITTITAVFHP